MAEDDLRFGMLSDSLGFLLRLAQLSAFGSYFEELGHLEVRPGELSVLFLIGENPGVRQGVLAKRLSIKRAHMTKMVGAMEVAGLVARRVPEDDRRSVELRLTEAGECRVSALRGPFEAHEMRHAKGMSPHETQQLKELLRKLLGVPEGAGRIR